MAIQKRILYIAALSERGLGEGTDTTNTTLKTIYVPFSLPGETVEAVCPKKKRRGKSIGFYEEIIEKINN